MHSLQWSSSFHWKYFGWVEEFEYTLWKRLVAQMVKCLSTIQETRVQSLGWDDPLEKEMAIHSSTIAGKSHGWRSLIGWSMGSQRVGRDWATSLHFPGCTFYVGSFRFPMCTCTASGLARSVWISWSFSSLHRACIQSQQN